MIEPRKVKKHTRKLNWINNLFLNNVLCTLIIENLHYSHLISYLLQELLQIVQHQAILVVPCAPNNSGKNF